MEKLGKEPWKVRNYFHVFFNNQNKIFIFLFFSHFWDYSHFLNRGKIVFWSESKSCVQLASPQSQTKLLDYPFYNLAYLLAPVQSLIQYTFFLLRLHAWIYQRKPAITIKYIRVINRSMLDNEVFVASFSICALTICILKSFKWYSRFKMGLNLGFFLQL